MATSYDYAPLYRSSVGFDRIVNLLENAQRARSSNDWPPYDIVKTDDDTYRISIAVAGFAQDDLNITFQSHFDSYQVRRKQYRLMMCGTHSSNSTGGISLEGWPAWTITTPDIRVVRVPCRAT